MARTLTWALAILLVSTTASADRDAGCGDVAAPDSGCATRPMEPPDEEDPGGCSCLWSDELPGAAVWSVVLLPPLALYQRRRRSPRKYKRT
jgi:hypothetical protein